ncbi:MAG: HD domain-containing protein [Solirubrobacterales bacterium]
MAATSTRSEPRGDSELPDLALRFARRAHLGQYRKQDHEQFVEHPIAVAELLSQRGFEEPVLAAAYLHDVAEKTEIGLDEIRERFGPEVAGLIDRLSEDPEIAPYGERKRALRRRVLEAGPDPVAIYAADRVANMRDWRRVAPERRERIARRLGTSVEERLELWGEDLEELSGLEPEPPFLAEIEAELRTLRDEVRPA